MAFIKSVQPTKIIPAYVKNCSAQLIKNIVCSRLHRGGNIINFFGGNFVSGNIQLICGNIFHKLVSWLKVDIIMCVILNYDRFVDILTKQ